MQKEVVPQVDKNDKLLGLVDKKEAYFNGWIHRGVHAVVRNTKGQYLVSQRSSTKSTWPNHYDLGLAETVKPDESYLEALERGLQEEMGLKNYTDSVLIRKQYYQEYFWEQYKIFGMLCLYTITIKGEPTSNDGEVQKFIWMSKAEVTSLINKKTEECTPWLIRDWKYYLEVSNLKNR